MNKISLIIQREYLTRVRKKSFIIMSILGPILFASLLVLPALLANMEDKEVKTIAVIDQSKVLTTYIAGQARSVIPDNKYMKFVPLENTGLDELKNNFQETGYYAVLFIPENIMASETTVLYSNKQPSLEVKSYIKDHLEKEIENLKLAANHIDNIDEILREIQTSIKVNGIKWTKDGEAKKSNTGVVMGIGYISGLLIYFFIFLFGAMVMRGVIEEKTSRIVEVIVSSVKPFQLMMGKIVGIGLVGLTQFLIWIVLTIFLVTGTQKIFLPELAGQQQVEQVTGGNDLFTQQAAQASEIKVTQDEGNELVMEVIGALESIDPIKIVLAFLFYFLTGFLLYGSLFAVVGSAVDNETDTQQFMLPITIPLVLGIIVMANVMNNPDGPLAFWFSIIPLTSPIVMMVRMPFDVPAWQLMISGIVMILTILLTIWMAGKIYRTGILMYGKKVSYKELWKWLRYKS